MDVMRTFLLALMISFAAAASGHAAEDPLVGLRFTDGQAHQLSDWPGQPVLIMYFCSHCPTARAWMGSQAVEVGKLIESDKLAAQLICVTPEFAGDQLKAYAEAVCKPITGIALFANDPANKEQISLKNIAQARLWVDGAVRMVDYQHVPEAVKDPFHASTAFLFPVGCELSPAGKTAWWGVERGRPGAFASCVSSAKKNPEAKAIVEVVSKVLLSRQETLLAAPGTMATYESLEDFCADGGGLPELKPSAERLRTLAKDKTIIVELKAREIYRNASKQASSVKPNDRETGKATLAQLAIKMPDTVYGKKAAD